MIDVKAIQAQAKREIAEEAAKVATSKLKDLYQLREKAVLAVNNIDRQIEAFLNEVSDLATYDKAGVDVSPKKR